MLFRNNIVGSLELVVEKKMSVESFRMMYQIGESWAYELLRRHKAGEPLEQERGHRKGIFNERQKEQIKTIYRSLQLEDYKMPSMTVLRACMIERDVKFAEVKSETYRNIVKNMPEYPEKRKSQIYRKRWEAPEVGYIIQGDTSTHAWIDGAKGFPMLLFIDDKSRYVLYARFIDSDNIENHKDAIKEWLQTYGKPYIVYYDNDPKYAKHGTIRKLLESIGISVINTRPHQPQGKGKLERKNGVFQDQLVFYIKDKGAKTLEEANKVLQWYVEKHNASYNRTIKSTPESVFKSGDVFQYMTQEEWAQTELAFAVQTSRKVSRINEISLNGKNILLPKIGKMPLAGRWVTVYFYTGIWIKMYYKNIFVAKFNWEEIHDS